jgi:hypothetical protein
MSGSVNICGWPFCARAAPPVITTSASAAISFLKIASESNVRSQYYRFGPSSKVAAGDNYHYVVFPLGKGGQFLSRRAQCGFIQGALDFEAASVHVNQGVGCDKQHPA